MSVLTLRAGTIKRIHVDRRVVAANRKRGACYQLPAITVQTSKGPYKAFAANVFGAGRMVQSTKPLACGARIWFETKARVEVVQ
jgi:hypothetical protein